jgi:ATP-dependent protease HslVU (ClpYQ) peptidase subunit
MSIVCAAIKGDEIAIAADTQMSKGSMVVTAKDLENCNKLLRVNDNVIGIVGWSAMSTMLETIIGEKAELFVMGDRKKIYRSLMNLHKEMKKNYFLETYEDSSQPVESTQLDALIININGIFEISGYRDVHQYSRFWAVGSGCRYSLGAMEALYGKANDAQVLVEAGVNAAAKFDKHCSLPATSEVMTLSAEQRVAIVS